MTKLFNLSSIVVYGEVTANGKTTSNTFTLVDFKTLTLEKGKLKVKYHPNNKTLTLETNKFLKNLFIGLKSGKYLKLSDNYFDLMPDQEVQVTVGEI
jgi:hypothetical protein